MWDNTGLEYVCDIDAIEQNRMWDLLQNKPLQDRPHVPNIMHMKLRAQCKPQRHYEIYLIDVELTVSEQDIRDWFRDDPQTIVDLIRERGQVIYSNRVEKNHVVIV